MTSSESKEPQGSGRSSNKCRCGHSGAWHPFSNGGACTADGCCCLGLVCDHTRCGWKPPEEAHDYVSPAHCKACMRAWIGPDAVLEDAEDVPLTPEEEEEAPPDPDACDHQCQCEHDHWDHSSSGCCKQCDCESSTGHYPTDCLEAPEDENKAICGNCYTDHAQGSCEPAEPPPQPDRRPPYAVAYSVSGHLYEVALPGDATVRAVDGALVIQHHLGPVAGIVSVLPVINKEQT